MMIWAVGNALSMMQGGPWHTARAPRVVRETGGTGRITGCGAQRVSNAVKIIKHTRLNLKSQQVKFKYVSYFPANN